MSCLDALLVLEDGRAFRGRGIGANGSPSSGAANSNNNNKTPNGTFGEVVFNTSMTGYQEILTDPSYRGQLVAFTAPQIGNYGVTPLDSQSPERDRAQLAGLIVRELSPAASNWRAAGDLDRWLERQGVAGISEVDTRALTRHLRQNGALRGGIFQVDAASPALAVAAKTGRASDSMVEAVRATPTMQGRDLAAQAGTARRYSLPAASGDARARIALVDYGVKRGILRGLAASGLAIEVHPAACSAQTLLADRPDGIVLSSGPGDPGVLDDAIALAKDLLGKRPLLGICLGHQLLGLALGGRTFKLPFGHHGGNHPVRDVKSGELWITAQNHGFAVDPDSLPPASEVTHLNLYDGTLEGFALAEQRVLAVQFHPEAGPGPSDAAPIFERFAQLVARDNGQPRNRGC